MLRMDLNSRFSSSGIFSGIASVYSLTVAHLYSYHLSYSSAISGVSAIIFTISLTVFFVSAFRYPYTFLPLC